MFLFEGTFGIVLHTGDCRLTQECYTRLPRRLFNGSLDCLFLDCTFGKEAVRMPLKEEAIKQVKQCIWNHPEAPLVYLACDLLGQETLLNSLCNCFGCKIYVDKHNLADFYGTLAVVAPNLITDDPQSTRFHVCEGFPKLYDRASQKFAAAHKNSEPEPLFIRPSAQWYTYGERLEGVGSGLLILEKICQKPPSITRRRSKAVPTQAERDPFGIWHVCYSMHSSQEELEAFLLKLRPRQVVSTTPNCKATELSYVQALNCDQAYQRVDRSFVSLASAEGKDAVQDTNKDLPSENKDFSEEIKGMPAAERGKHPSFLLTSQSRSIPLFGMAVAGLPPSPPVSFDSEEYLSEDEDEANSASDCAEIHKTSVSDCPEIHKTTSLETINRNTVIQIVQCFNHENPVPNQVYQQNAVGSYTEERYNSIEKERQIRSEVLVSPVKDYSSYPIKNCGFGETTRRIYRSLNMSIPRPLPSLLEIDREIKRSKF